MVGTKPWGRLLGAARAARAAGPPVLSGLLLFAASPAVGAWPLAFVALVPLWAVVRKAPPGRALALGWLGGTAANLVGFAWGVDLLERFGHLSVPAAVAAVALVSVYQASVLGMWAGATSLLCRQRVSPFLAAPLCLAVAEAAVPMIFPWYVALVAFRAWPVVQVAELGGPPAVSAWLMLANLVLAEAALAVRDRRSPARPGRGPRLAALVALAVLAAGLLRAAHVEHIRAHAARIRVGIVQPNFGILPIKDRERRGQEYIETLRGATVEAGRKGAELVVWPESAFPFLVDRQLGQEYAPGHPWELRGSFKGRLVVGALTHLFGTSYVYNSAVLVSGSGVFAGTYDKRRLLAFGEYIPFADRFPDWAMRTRKSLPDWPEIEPGAGPRLLEDGDLRIAAFICYEDIFPDLVHEAVRPRAARLGPNLLLTVANHAWFGESAAPLHALALATLRSVETRRDLVRATTTGVSSIGDALGRVAVEGPLRPHLPQGDDRRPTLLLGDVALMESFALGPYCAPYFPYACALALAAATLRAWLRRRSA